MSTASTTANPGVDSSRVATGDSRKRLDLLQDCRELVVSRLSRVIGDALAKMSEELSELALGARESHEQAALLDAVSVVREHGAEIELRFRRSFTEVFERRMRDEKAPVAPEIAAPGELALVDDSVMQAKIAVDRLVGRARGQLDPEEVLGVRARLAALLEREWFEEERHPASPEAIFEALKSALAELAPRPEVQAALLDAFEPHVSANLNKVYSTVNDRLKAGDVLPRIRPQVVRRGGQGPRPMGTAQGQGETADGAGYGSAEGGAYGAGHGGGYGAAHGGGYGARHGGAYGAGHGGGHGAAHGGGHGSRQGGAYGAGHGGGYGADYGPDDGSGYGAPQGAGYRAGPGGSAAGRTMRARELGSMLSQLAHGGPVARASATRMLADPETFAVADLPIPDVQPPLLEALSGLQASSLGGAASPPDLMSDIVERARESGSPLDQLTVEIVSMVFDYIYADKRLADVVKQQLLRLQVVAVKAALIDRSFFARRTHPMRRLIDRISEVAADADSDLGVNSPLAKGVETVVEWVLLQFNRDLAIFEEARERVEALATDEAARRAERLANVTRDAERDESIIHARGLAMARFSDRLDAETPRFIRDFLADWWSLALAEAQVSAGAASIDHAEALSVGESLIWSVQSKQAEEVPRLAALLPRMINSLIRGLRLVSMPDERREAFFDDLLQAHTRAIEGAKQSAARRPTNLSMRPDGQIQFVPVSAPSGGVRIDPPVVEARSISLGELRRGDTIEVDMNGDGQFLSYRLAWISPAQRIFVISRFPDGASSLDRAQLAAMFDGGRARFADSGSALDKAIEAVGAASGAVSRTSAAAQAR